MKTDTIFYTLFQTFPSIFFELINRSPAEATNYEFTSREVKQLAFRLDGLFLPTNNDNQQPFYLLEVQFQPDEDLYYRLFAELFLYLRQYKPPLPWQVVVIYPSRSIEREQTLQFTEMLALNRVTRIYLDELGEIAESSLGVGVVKLVIEAEDSAPQLAQRLVQQAREQLTDAAIQRDLIKLIETIIVYKLPHKSREEIEAMFSLSDLKHTRVYQEALAEGKQEGIQEGKQEGRQEGKQEAIPRMIEFGLSLDAIAQLLDLQPSFVESAAQLFYNQNVAAFIQLLNNQQALFSPQNLAELTELIAPLPDDIGELSQALTSWCKQPDNSSILENLRTVRQNLAENQNIEVQVNKGVLISSLQQT